MNRAGRREESGLSAGRGGGKIQKKADSIKVTAVPPKQKRARMTETRLEIPSSAMGENKFSSIEKLPMASMCTDGEDVDAKERGLHFYHTR